jgi:hypothetical protein
MKLPPLAIKILDNPMGYLDLEHSERKAINSSHLWSVKQPPCSKDDFVNALNSIRDRASQRGVNVPQKDLIHESIRAYALKVWSRFPSLNQLNNHLKGLYGSELPKKFRNEFNTIFQEGTPPTEPQSAPQIVEVVGQTHITLGGLDFKLTSGSSLTIGELTTESLNLVGLKSIKIDKVANGRIYGVLLEA